MSSDPKPPTRNELTPYDSLDDLTLVRNFLGKNQDDALKMFQKNLSASYYTDDFMWMESGALDYYFTSAIRYLRTEQGAGDWDFQLGLFSTLRHRYRRGEFPEELKRRVVSFAADILNGKYGIELDDYLREEIVGILEFKDQNS